MAQKQYAFDFVLNAVLNGGFSGTFSKAQQEFVRLGNEIKNLQALQRDVTAYQKQAAAVQNTSAKLENLNRQYQLINKQISETTGSTTALEREKLKLEQRIANTTAALDKQRERLDGTKERLDAAGVSTDNLAGKDEELKKKIEELAEEQKKAAEGAGEFQSAGVQAIDAVAGAIAAGGIAEGLRVIKDAYVECVGVAAGFGQEMSAVKAIAEANKSEMAALSAEAKELGATTIYTAQQSAKGMEYMAMAGWKPKEMLAGMSGMTTLAAAAGEDLAQVSDIVTDNLSAFGLKASDTAHFADVLASAAANSNTNISIMGETFKNSSSVAGALGYSIEDVAVMVGLMANNAVKGSRAGTALRNIFNGLLGGVTLTGEAFGELDYSAVNTDGSMKGLMETVEDLRGYFDQMTEAERVNNAQTIAGMRGYNGLLAILKATDEDFQSLYASVSNCAGAAERMAKVKLDNLNGDVTIMKSAMEALQSTIGEQFNPELRELSQLGTGLLNGMNSFIKANPELARGVMAGAGAFAAMGTAIVGVNAAMKAFQALNLAKLFSSAGPLLGMAAGVAALTAVVVASTKEVEAATYASQEQLKRLEELNSEYENAVSLYGETSEEAGRLRYEINVLNDEYQNGVNTTKELAQQHEDLMAAVEESAAGYRDAAAESRESALDAAALAAKLKELASAGNQSDGELELMSGIVAELNGRFDGLNLNLDDVISGTGSWETALDSIIRKQAEAAEKAEAMQRAIELVGEKSRLDADKAAFEKEIAAAEADVKRLQALNDADANNYWGIGPYSEELEAARNRLNGYRGSLEETNEAIEANETEYERLLGILGDEADALNESASGEARIQDALSGTLESMEALTAAYTDAYDAALESFSGQFGLFDTARADAEATVEAAQKALDSQLSYWQNYAANIETLKGQSFDELHVTQSNYDALMAYVRNGTPEAAGLAASMVKAVNEGNTQALANLANTLGEIEESQNAAAGDVAEWTTGLNEQMDQLILDMGEDVKGLDMGEDAALAAENTIQSYIDKAGEMLPEVEAAYRRLRSAANNALGGAYRGSYFDIPGHANGTDNAPPGWSWVGEAGPELMRMRGGEQILPNSVSRQVVADYSEYSRYAARGVPQFRPPLEVAVGGQTSSGSKVEMHFHIEAGASPETVSAWQEYANSGELRATILEVIEDAEADTRRHALV